jgi:O-acetylserine/cysteine efflux transporter
MPSKPLTLRDGLLALAVMAVWGTNFVVIRFGLDDLPPLLFAALRFTLALLPAVFFLKRPPVPWVNLAAYGVLIGAGQFGLLYIAMRADITPGLASLVMQVQVFFTVGLSLWLFSEQVHARNLIGLALAAGGLSIIGMNLDAATTPRGLVLVLLAAASWAAANITVKYAAKAHGKFDVLGFMIWSSVFGVPPLAVLALVLEGYAPALEAITTAGWGAWAAVLWQSLGNTLFGFGIWNWLLARHSAAVFTPTALLVPVFGMAASSIVLGEPLYAWKLLAAGLVIAGLAVNMFGGKLFRS